jgi:hypothetical protein
MMEGERIDDSFFFFFQTTIKKRRTSESNFFLKRTIDVLNCHQCALFLLYFLHWSDIGLFGQLLCYGNECQKRNKEKLTKLRLQFFDGIGVRDFLFLFDVAGQFLLFLGWLNMLSADKHLGSLGFANADCHQRLQTLKALCHDFCHFEKRLIKYIKRKNTYQELLVILDPYCGEDPNQTTYIY